MSLIDKVAQYSGLQGGAPDKQITTRNNLLIINSDDFVGQRSLLDTQLYLDTLGIRGTLDGHISNTTGLGVPITVTLFGTNPGLRDGDTLTIEGVTGNTAANGLHVIGNVTGTTFDIPGVWGNGPYTGGGIWIKKPDSGYPRGYPNIINGNVMTIKINPLKCIRDISITNLSVPRNIIPIIVYYPDMYTASTKDTSITYIPQNSRILDQELEGLFSTPLSVFRTYRGIFALPDQITPSPITLWNPPTGAWPSQPVPYPFQSVPTFVSNVFPLGTGTGYLVCSGLGVYDLLDWTSNTGVPTVDSVLTDSIRKYLLIAIVQTQGLTLGDSFWGTLGLILASSTVTPGNLVYPYGWGDYQRFLPGPGIGQQYQPGTQDGADPTTPGVDWPVPFPQFRGNVWGPYDCPGAPFQKLGLLTQVQDLFLNGDLSNPFGNPIVLNNVPISSFTVNSTYGISVPINTIDWDTLQVCTNLNVLNAMRIIPNGFGTSTVVATGNGTFSSVVYLHGGGQGPSTQGIPSSWNTVGVNGTSSFSYPVGTGSQSGDPVPQNVGASITTIGDSTQPLNRNAWSDLGANKGQFVQLMINYLQGTIAQIPDTNLVMKVSESERTMRSQCTNSTNQVAMFNIPIRLSTGSVTGTQKYQESLQSLMGPSYFTFRFLNPLPKLSECTLEFTTYEGLPIPLEKVLAPRNITKYMESLLESGIQVPGGLSPGIFNPTVPILAGRMQSAMQIFFNIRVFEYVSTGLYNSIIIGQLSENEFIEES